MMSSICELSGGTTEVSCGQLDLSRACPAEFRELPMRNACLDAAVAELKAAGVRDYQVARGGKHLQLRWSVNGHGLRMLTIPVTPSDWRSPANTRSDLRRLLRQDGLLEQNGVRPVPKPDPDLWQRQLQELIRRLNRLQVPAEATAERDEIAAAMRKLLNRTIQQKENGHGE
jgi:hypothetical protein